jgi:hemerythrin-like domain-containing protein
MSLTQAMADDRVMKENCSIGTTGASSAIEETAMKSTALLMEDHRLMLRVLDVLAEMASRAEREHYVNPEDVAGVVDFLRGFGDRYHQGREEGVLFPALLRVSPQRNYRELSGQIFEHNRQRSLIEGLHDSILTKKAKEFIYCARHLNLLLRAHMEQEDNTVFRLVDSTLSAAEDEQVARDMKVYDQYWQDRELSGLLLRLEKLESKYLNKAPTG